MNIGIIMQARMSSTRLPGKILKPFYGTQTLIDTILATLHDIHDVNIIVATTDNPNDDRLYDYLIYKGENVVRGSETDVLDRFITSAVKFGIDGIVRICSDNPFLDRNGIIDLIEKAKTSNADYIGFRINNKPSILTHFGFWGEFVRLSALKKVAKSTPVGSPAHEHVTYHIYNHPKEFLCEWLECPECLQGRNDIRLTIDTPEDFHNASLIYAELKRNGNHISIRDIVNYIDSHNDIKDSMIRKIQENQK